MLYCFRSVRIFSPSEKSSREKVKEKIVTTFFKGMLYEELQNLGVDYVNSQLNHLIKHEAYQKFKWHKEQGHFCVLVSAAPEFYLQEWGKLHQFDAILATRLEVLPNRTISGKINGFNCWGPEKVKRLNELLGGKNYQLYAYGDSRGDQELLQSADHSFYRSF